MNIAKILADNQDYLKINNIEKAMGLKKTALVRMIARKEIPEKHKKSIEDWWGKFIDALSYPEIPPPKGIVAEVLSNPKYELKISSENELLQPKWLTTMIEKNSQSISNKEIKKQIEAIVAEKCPKERDTSLGRKIWLKEQENRINELKSQLINK